MEKKIRSIHIIINPAAGIGESILPIINASMKEAGITWEASITHQGGDAIRYAKAAVKNGVDALAVYGGDGTLREAISGLIGSEIPLIILPGGSANVMANELGLPTDLKEACKLLSHGSLKTKIIDVGQFDKHVGHWQGKDISVSSGSKQSVQCDGEVLEKVPQHIKIIPGAIKVLVPKKMDKIVE